MPKREKTFFLNCAPNEEVFIVRMKTLCSLAVQNVPSEDSDQNVPMC